MAKVLMVAAEASSGLFAERLLQYWKSEKRQIEAFGVGTPQMEALGFRRLGKSEEMAVVGAAEVIEHFTDLKAVFHSLVNEATKQKPDVAVLMDYPDFNLMLAKRLKALSIPVVYYISPQVWAWRKGRVEKIRKFCEKVLLLFPFEVEFYKSKGIAHEFVGHPLLDELDDKYFDPVARDIHRKRYGIQTDDVVIGLMPGSRSGEVKHHLQLQLQVARFLNKQFKNLKFALLVAPTRTKEEFQDQLGDLKIPLLLLKDEPFEMIDVCDFMLAASGTATLQVALLEKPMVIMYKLSPITEWLARVLVRGVRYFGLPNLILGREVVPERWKSDVNPEGLSKLMADYLLHPEKAQAAREGLAEIKKLLGEKGATKRVAASLAGYLK